MIRKKLGLRMGIQIGVVFQPGSNRSAIEGRDALSKVNQSGASMKPIRPLPRDSLQKGNFVFPPEFE